MLLLGIVRHFKNSLNVSLDYIHYLPLLVNLKKEKGFPGGTSGKEPACQRRRLKRRRFDPWVGNGNPLQYSCLENSMDRGAWRATVYGVIKSQTRLSN